MPGSQQRSPFPYPDQQRVAALLLAAAFLSAGCTQDVETVPATQITPPPVAEEPARPDTAAERRFAAARQEMVNKQLRRRDITNEAVLAAMARVPRHRFVPAPWRDQAYADHARLRKQMMTRYEAALDLGDVG